MNHNKNISLTTLSTLESTATCDGYMYLVTVNHSSHRAFRTFEGLSKYMAERGLNFSTELPEHGTHSHQPLVGEYFEQMHYSYDAFYALEGYETKTLSNGEYTQAIITADDKGLRTVNTMNPNCKMRRVYDYWKTREEMC